MNTTDVLALIAIFVSIIALIPSLISYIKTFEKLKFYLFNKRLNENSTEYTLLAMNKSSSPGCIISVKINGISCKIEPVYLLPNESKEITLKFRKVDYSLIAEVEIKTTNKTYIFKANFKQ